MLGVIMAFILSWNDFNRGELAEAIEPMFIRSFLTCYRTSQTRGHMSDKDIAAYLENYFTKYVRPRLVSEEEQWFCFAREGDELIGFAIFEKHPNREIYVAELAISPEHWRKGLGKAMMDAILEKEPETRKILLITEHDNKLSQKFYEGLGYRRSSYMHGGYSEEVYCGYEKDVIHE